MSHSALVVQVLISGPSDLPPEHRELIRKSMRTWNAAHGRVYGLHYTPVDWEEGATAAFGEYAQAVLNEQIVDNSDIGIVVFTDKMGSPTPGHPSGTAEEIERMLDAGKDVAILQNDCERAPARGEAAAEQRQALEAYIKELRDRAFISSYKSTEDLVRIMDGQLSRLASKHRHESDAALIAGSAAAAPAVNATDDVDEKGVWPRLEVSEYPETDRRGRLKTKRKWRLVLESTLPHKVHNVRYRYEDADGNPRDDFDLYHSRSEPVEIAPRGRVEFPILQSMGSPGSAMCVVTWDHDGTEHETRATVRTH